MKTKELRRLIGCSQVSKVRGGNGQYIARQSFFYRHGRTWEHLANTIKAKMPHSEILTYGEKYCAFRGGAPVSKQSHWWVIFKIS